MGFCTTPSSTRTSCARRRNSRGCWSRDGIHLFKFYLEIGREMQLMRFHERRHDPLKRWKITDIDLAAMAKWDDYSKAKEEMFRFTHTADRAVDRDPRQRPAPRPARGHPHRSSRLRLRGQGREGRRHARCQHRRRRAEIFRDEVARPTAACAAVGRRNQALSLERISPNSSKLSPLSAQLHGLDRIEIRRAGVDLDARAAAAAPRGPSGWRPAS